MTVEVRNSFNERCESNPHQEADDSVWKCSVILQCTFIDILVMPEKSKQKLLQKSQCL